MSHGIRLPTLYPMPKDMDQYWVCYSASLDEPSEDTYAQRLTQALRKEDGGEYASSMIAGIVSSITKTGFVRKESGVMLPPDKSRWHLTDEWDGSEAGFVKYVDATLLKWGKLFLDGLVLAYDLLSVLSQEPTTQAALLEALVGDDEMPGKYDGRDRYAARTVRETIKLLEFANWVERNGRKVKVTSRGEGRRGDLRDRNTYRQVEKILTTVDPVATDIFKPHEKVKLSKHYMYRECGGKYRSEIIDKAHDIIYEYPYHSKLRKEIRQALKEEDRKREALKNEIEELDSAFGSAVELFRSRAKLRLIRDALRMDRTERALEIIQQSGGHFSWESLRQLKHEGEDYTIAPEIEPYAWQSEALEEWRVSGRRGVLEVVTGAGKTVFAMMALEELLDTHPETHTTVLVPTKVLMYQWATELVRVLGVPPEHIGLRGDGHKDSFAAGKRVMITIINSAVQDEYLSEDVMSLPDEVPHFLIGDECHRYRGEEFRKAFRARYDFSLGLSATPIDPDQRTTPEAMGKQDVVLEALGPIFFAYSYQEALADEVVQEFIVRYVGVDLTSGERRLYEAYTKQIRKSLERIRARYGPRLEAMPGPLFARLHTILNTDESPDPAISRYFTAVRERKDLVFAARNRKWAYLDIIAQHTSSKADEDPEDKIIVFHERIENLEDVVAPKDRRKVLEGEEKLTAFRGLGIRGDDETSQIPAKYRTDPVEKHVDQNLEELFFKASFKPVMYHSGHSSQAWNEIGMEWFREGIANVMLSVKALVEGVDVPAANVGIIRASSSSVRQRIQTTGRILRRAAGKERPAILYVIYVRDTTDERIFRGMDWTQQLGESAVRSDHWQAPDHPDSIHGEWTDLGGRLPDVATFENEDYDDFDVDELEPGDPYPGKYAGWEYHVDAEGRPFKKSRNARKFILNEDVKIAARRIFEWKRGGKFVVTPQNHIVSKVKGRGLVFVGTLEGEIELEDLSETETPRPFSGRPPTFEELFGG